MTSTYPPDYTTDVGAVRLLIPDVSETYVFTDTQIRVFLSLNGDDVLLAAAAAVDVQASDLAANPTVTTDDLRVDFASSVKALREHAASLREQAANSSFDIVFPDDVFEFPSDDYYGDVSWLWMR